MPFEDDLQLALYPTGSEQLPRELHLGRWAHSWTNGKVEWEGYTPGFRKLGAEELRQLMRRLQAAPQHHVILLNLMGHDIVGDMMRELAEAIAALKALQVLILAGKVPPSPPPPPCICFMAAGAFSHAADNNIGDSGCTALAGALPRLSALQILGLGSNYFRYFALYFAA
jgi:hypothetical protein